MGLACTWTPENRRPVSDGFRARYLFFRMERADWISQQLGFTAARIHRVQPISLLKQLLESGGRRWSPILDTTLGKDPLEDPSRGDSQLRPDSGESRENTEINYLIHFIQIVHELDGSSATLLDGSI